MKAYDTIVIGCGGVGAAALYHLARSGRRVLGLDRFLPGHGRGSSHGDTRVIRLSYMEHPDYVPLLRRAYTLWEELEARAGRTLYHEVGLLQVGPPDGHVVPGVLASARLHRLDVEELTPAAARARFPGLNVPEGQRAVFERRAGYLDVEDCVRAHADLAVQAGAELEIGPAVRSWRDLGTGVEVVTERSTYHADTVVITAGSWAGQLLGDLGVPLPVKRKPLFWFPTTTPALQETQGCPCYLFEDPAGFFYGFPVRPGETAIKLAEHTGGRFVDDPLDVDRSLDAEEAGRVAEFHARTLVGVSREVARHAVCLYTMSPDENFIVDRHPEYPRAVFAAGLSGHGFKFASVLGEVLAGLASGEAPSSPIGFLALARLRPKEAPVNHNPADNVAAKKILDEGIAYFKKGKTREAVSKLLEVVARFPQSDVADNAHYNLGQIYERQGLREKAHNEYEAVVLFYPDSDAAQFAKDRLQALEEAADPAAQVFRQAQELYRAKRYAEAIARYEDLLARFPKSTLYDNALLGLGMLHRFHGDPQRASELFHRLRTQYPDSDATHLLDRE